MKNSFEFVLENSKRKSHLIGIDPGKELKAVFFFRNSCLTKRFDIILEITH